MKIQRIFFLVTFTSMPELRSENPIYCDLAFETKMHDVCLEVSHFQTPKCVDFFTKSCIDCLDWPV